MKTIFEKFRNPKDDYFALLPILSMISIIFYYRFDFRVNYIISSIFAIISITSYSLRYYNPILKTISIAIFYISIGFLASDFREKNLTSKPIGRKIENVKICGKVLSLSIGLKDDIVLIDEIISENKKVPNKIRFYVEKDLFTKKISPSDFVCFFANLFPLPKPVYKNAYNFSDVAKYQKIGSLGRAISDVEVKQHSTSIFDSFFEKIRLKIDDIFIKIMKNSNEAGISMALFTANKKYITQDLMNDVKKSGLSHLLAISGLHISIIAISVFKISRRILALNEKLAICYDIRKIAAVIAFFVSFLHLQISSAPLSAVRSFLMFSFAIFGILFEKKPNGIRFLSFAFFLIIMQKPESIFNPSLQMSFMAVLSLISGFLILSVKIEDRYFDAGRFLRFILYFFAIFLSSILATFSTAFFTIYHFNQFSISGLLANIIAVPVIEFLSIPLGVIGLFLSFFGIEYIPLKLMQFSNYIFIKTANYFANMKHSYVVISEMPISALFFYSMSLIFLFILRSSIRYYLFLIFFIVAIVLHSTFRLPDVVIGRGADDFIFKSSKSKYVSKDLIENDFVNSLYSGKLGQKKIEKSNQEEVDKLFKKYDKYEIFFQNNILIYIINDEIEQGDCNTFLNIKGKKTYILDRPDTFRKICKTNKSFARLIPNWKIRRFGSYVIFG